jgi:hypothetical protein
MALIFSVEHHEIDISIDDESVTLFVNLKPRHDWQLRYVAATILSGFAISA